MQFRAFIEPQQGASYSTQLRFAQASERLGYDAFFRSDHLRPLGNTDGWPGPTESWVTLGAIARETQGIRLGTLLTSATFRRPGVLAMAVAQVDEMSGGRVELGLGAGWYQAEHEAYGIPFPPSGERFDRLEEQLEVITGLWNTPVGTPYSYVGRHYTLRDAPALPKPVQATLPIIVGGFGARRTPALAARFAAEFNLAFGSLADWNQQRDRVDAACTTIGRDPSTLVRSAALRVGCGANQSEVDRRLALIHEMEPTWDPAHGACGTVNEVTDTLGAWRDAGTERVYLQFLDLADLDQLALVAESVMPTFAS